MIGTAEKPLTAKQSSFVQYFADPGSEAYNNATMACIMAGYARSSAKVSGHNNITNYNVKQSIERYRAEITQELDWRREENNKACLASKVELERLMALYPLNMSIRGQYHNLIRELNASNGLHSQTINTNNKTLAINVVGRSTGASGNLDPNPTQPALEARSGTGAADKASDVGDTGQEHGRIGDVVEEKVDSGDMKGVGEGVESGGRGPIVAPHPPNPIPIQDPGDRDGRRT